MTILSIACTKLLCTNAHLGRRRVAAHHFKVYICGSRNGIAILDSDKTLICLRTALHFIGSPIRQKCRSFLLKTNHLFRYEILEEMTSCINASQWKIGSNYLANKIKFRSRTKKISFGLNQQPDCAFILNADRKSSVILEADRSQIPIAFLVDSTSPWESQKRITYPIPANDPIQYMYLFRHSITKTGILERPRIPAMSVSRRGTAAPTWSTGVHIRSYCSDSGGGSYNSPGPGRIHPEVKSLLEENPRISEAKYHDMLRKLNLDEKTFLQILRKNKRETSMDLTLSLLKDEGGYSLESQISIVDNILVDLNEDLFAITNYYSIPPVEVDVSMDEFYDQLMEMQWKTEKNQEREERLALPDEERQALEEEALEEVESEIAFWEEVKSRLKTQSKTQ